MAKRKMIPSTDDKPWLTHEQISGLFETALNPDAKVSVSTPRDRPDITGTLRQLDVEILAGLGHRQTRHIVEVQKRKGKVGIATFEGWLDKKRKLNAALLICVCEKGFSKDVIAAAKHEHPLDVKLGLLQKVKAEDVHPHFKSQIMGFTEVDTKTTYLSDFKLITTEDHVIELSSGAFSVPVFDGRSLHDVVSGGIRQGVVPFERERELVINLSDIPVFRHPDLTETPRIRQVKVRVTVTREASREVPVEYYLYKQIFPEEDVIGACVLAANIRANNIRGNLAIILLPRPDDVMAMISFQALQEAASSGT